MGKGNGGTRSNGTSTGGVVPAPVDEYAAWRAKEGSELYDYDRDKVKFEVMKPVQDLDGTYIDGITPEMLRYKTNYVIYGVPRNMRDGKFHMGSDEEYWYDKTMTFNQAINRTIKDAKDGYRYNEKTRDIVMKVESEDEKAPSAWIWVYLEGKNKVRISIDRFKPGI